ncbi:general secretory pathway component, cryptic [Rubrivivax sp. A210]|uniref:GspE/PulE family protein n=1 Tax=Rubrivivax sp. A210 TaxID=2772301 RepID=UPI00191B8B2E|nr:GspE/PulE family protein [Rubrivivax sp. A210]CAD5370971.1 general secretory pathway component, cryptic [Rubrivivax sp. A210]
MNAALESRGVSQVRSADVLAACLTPALGPWRAAFDLWPPAEAQRWRVVLAQSPRGELAALSDAPIPQPLLERLETRLQRRVQRHRQDAASIDTLIALGAAEYRALAAVGDTGGEGGEGAEAAQELSALHLAEQESPVVRLLDATLYDALHDGVSDVHFECEPRGMSIRYRVDGVMQPVRRVEGSQIAEQLVSRLKVMSELDIGERRLPQDGRFMLRLSGREIDFRLSVMPTAHGEDAVVRVLDRARIEQTQGQLSLAALGLPAVTCATLRRLALQPHGMLLVTGPTGSGKATTLYAMLSEINQGRDKIVTIEDPVEYQLAGIAQVPVNERKGLTFARGLRSILRHDPDRVMVGEIRDPETAQIAVQAALTGHLVFSTVHANSAFDVIGRFMHMGLDLYNVVSALNAVLAQRLLRLNCSHCSVPVAPLHQAHGLLAIGADDVTDDAGDGGRPMRGVGCSHCRHTGYRGRRAVTELMLMNDELRDLIAARAPMTRIRQAAVASGMVLLRDAALAAVRRGETTLEEAERVTSDA